MSKLSASILTEKPPREPTRTPIAQEFIAKHSAPAMGVLNSYCPEGRHHVALENMSWLNTAKPGIRRRMCVDCKNRIVGLRKALPPVAQRRAA